MRRDRWGLHREPYVPLAHQLQARSVTLFVPARHRHPDNFAPARRKVHDRERRSNFVREPEPKAVREQRRAKDGRAVRRRVFRNGREADREADATIKRPWEHSVPELAYRRQNPASRSMRASRRHAAVR